MKKYTAIIALAFGTLAFGQSPQQPQAEKTKAELQVENDQLTLQLIQLQFEVLQAKYNETQSALAKDQESVRKEQTSKTPKKEIKPALPSKK